MALSMPDHQPAGLIKMVVPTPPTRQRALITKAVALRYQRPFGVLPVARMS